MRLVSAEQMRAIDRHTIDVVGIPGPELMENAGQGTAEQILADHIETPAESPVVVFCGKGNNGGDGYVIARCLYQAEVPVTVYFFGPLDSLSEDARLNFDRAAGLGVPMIEITNMAQLPELLDCELIVDAIFGTGFTGSPRGLSGEVIDYINRQGVEVIAVDIPSGLNADNGEHEGSVIAAEVTYTMALPKYGLYLSPGRELSGVVDTIPIGVPDSVIEHFDLPSELITPEYIIDLLPPRKPDGHKGDFGKVLILAGSTGMTGAASLAGQASARSGAGLVKIACPNSILPIIAGKLTEVMTYPLPDVAKRGALALRGLGELRSLAQTHDAVVVGPGVGRHRETAELIRRFVSSADAPMIIDADGLNAFEDHLDVIEACEVPIVLTPHPGEFTRLIGEAVPEDIHERVELACEVATKLGVVLILKGSPTLVVQPGGLVYLNQTGNDGMATGGSGDVLSGIIGTFLAQDMTAIDAAVAAVFVHGLAGDLAAEGFTSRSMIAGDIVSFLPKTFALLEE